MDLSQSAWSLASARRSRHVARSGARSLSSCFCERASRCSEISAFVRRVSHSVSSHSSPRCAFARMRMTDEAILEARPFPVAWHAASSVERVPRFHRNR